MPSLKLTKNDKELIWFALDILQADYEDHPSPKTSLLLKQIQILRQKLIPERGQHDQD